MDLNEIREIFEYRIDNPLNINTCDENELRELNILNEQQIKSFFDYIRTFGLLFSKYELQAIPYFDLQTVLILNSLVTVGNAESHYQNSLISMVRDLSLIHISEPTRPY